MQTTLLSSGIIDLIYPLHWRSYIVNDLDKKTDIDIYANRRVIRQGRYLSLHVEAKYFPLHGWRKNLILVMGSLLILIMLLLYAPLSLPLKKGLSINWIQGVQRHKVTDIEALAKIPLRVGDMLQIQGRGMCYVPPSSKQSHNFVFTPFDCSSIYWNKGLPLPQPESAVIEKAAALMSAVKQQLHPPMPSLQTRSDANTTLPPAVTVEKPEMALLKNFADIVLKTGTLCEKTSDCIRLKNALVNLCNTNDWASLVISARSGALSGVNVLLRPVSANALKKLINVEFVFKPMPVMICTKMPPFVKIQNLWTQKMAETPCYQQIPTNLNLQHFNPFVFPHLSTGRRGPASKLSLYKRFNYILQILYMGCQWKMLPIEKDQHGKAEIHYTNQHRPFRRWERDGSIAQIFTQSVLKLHQDHLLDTSVFHGDGTTTAAKKGGNNIGYSGHKKVKGDKIVAFCDRNCNVIAPFVSAPGNRNDSPRLRKAVPILSSITQSIGLSLKGGVFSV